MYFTCENLNETLMNFHEGKCNCLCSHLININEM